MIPSSPSNSENKSSPPPREGSAQPSWRSKHRARNHDSAHAEGAAAALAPVPSHPLIPAGPHELITRQQGLVDLLEHLRQAKQFAYDSEFIGELTYHPRLCLIQVATTEKVSLIDPMDGIDLHPFWELLCDPAVEKIVHAGEQDMEPVVRHLGRQPANILDTQIAAGFVGMAYPVSLSKLVQELTGVKLGKGLTFTDWSQRPLSNVQLRYAADDVRYLPAMAADLKARLAANGHLAWAKEESDSTGNPSRFIFDPDTDYLRVRGASGLPPQSLAVLRELTAWRDDAAQKADAPPRAFLKDEILIDMARSPIKSIDRLARVKGLPRPVESHHGAAIVEATLRGLAVKSDTLPARHPEPTPAQRFAADALWATLLSLCAGRGIDANLVTSRQEVGELYRHLAMGTDPSHLRLLRGWRATAAGLTLLQLYEGKQELVLHWNQGQLSGRAGQLPPK
jgi:ribonuclease D